jgi:quercetin dioxygenase-like cupin family protein
MSFHRFEDNATKGFTPHISTSKNHLVDGDYLYFNLNTKPAGTGSELHYHPNELLVFCIRGRINGIVGKDRHIITPGTFVVVPPNARHSFKATEEEDCAYLYIKDHTWTLVGVSADEALPDKAMSVEEAHKLNDSGTWPGQRETVGQSTAIIEGFSSCFYKVLDSIDQPIGQCDREIIISGTRIIFGLYEFARAFEKGSDASTNEQFIYMLTGKMNASVGGETREIGAGDIVHVKKGASYSLKGSAGDEGARYAVVRSTSHMEETVDNQPKEKS